MRCSAGGLQVGMVALCALLVLTTASADSSDIMLSEGSQDSLFDQEVHWVSYKDVKCAVGSESKALSCTTWLMVQPKSVSRPYNVQLRYCQGTLEARSNEGKPITFDVKPDVCYGAGAKLAGFWRSLASKYLDSGSASAQAAAQSKALLEKAAEKAKKSSLAMAEKARENLAKAAALVTSGAQSAAVAKRKHAAVQELATKADATYSASENRWKESAHKESASKAKVQEAAAVKSKQMADKAVAVADEEQKLSNEKNAKLEVHDSSSKERSEKSSASIKQQDSHLSVRSQVAKAMKTDKPELGEAGFGYKSNELNNLFSSIAAFAGSSRRNVALANTDSEVHSLGEDLGEGLHLHNDNITIPHQPNPIEVAGPYVHDSGSFMLSTKTSMVVDANKP